MWYLAIYQLLLPSVHDQGMTEAKGKKRGRRSSAASPKQDITPSSI
jgi:hypothetical protein